MRIISLCTGLFAGLMFAFNRGVWLWSCVPEMRILSVFMFILTAFLFFKWMLYPQQRWLLLLALFIYGLGIANHQTLTVMAAPFTLTDYYLADRCRRSTFNFRGRNGAETGGTSRDARPCGRPDGRRGWRVNSA